MWCGRSICDYDLGSVFDDMDDLACEAIHPDDIEEVYIAAVIEQLEKEKQEKYAGVSLHIFLCICLGPLEGGL